jgi:ribosome maturation factor RimP
LTQPRHFAKNVSRLLKIIKLDGSEVTGRILSNTDKDVTLSVAVKKETIEEVVTLADIKRAVVEIEFNRNDDK